jgi:enoyl-CoA hydratase/carnithine racemase
MPRWRPRRWRGVDPEPETATQWEAFVTSELVAYEARDGIGYVTLNRPEVLNALNDDLIKQLREVLYQLDDDADALVGILSGSGRAFCSGADIKQRQLRPKEELARLGSPQGRGAHIEDLFQRFVNWKPIIAAVHGYAIGAGLHMALMCEMIVASEGSQFWIPEIPRGLWVANFWKLLSHRTGGGFATDVCLTARYWTAEEGYQRGVVDRLAPSGSHMKHAEDLAKVILAHPPLAVREAVHVRRGELEQLELQSRLVRKRELHLTDDFRESATAFAEKRQPVFHGR